MKKQHLSLLALSALLLTSCATIFSGTRARVIIDGDAPEPLTIVADEQTYDSVSLPASLSIRRDKLTEPITLTSPHYDYADIIPGRNTNLWIWANYFNGFLGLPVDLMTGAIYEPAMSRYYISKRSKEESIGAEPLAPVGVSSEPRLYRHEIDVLAGLGSSVWRGAHDRQVGQFRDMGMEHPFFCGVDIDGATCGVDVDGATWGLRYFYHISPRVAVGAAFGRAWAYDGLETPLDPEDPDAYALSPYAHVHTRSTFAMPAVKYSWIHEDVYSLYSIAALGAQCSHTWASIHTHEASLFPELRYEHHRQEVFNRKRWKLAPQLTALGFDAGGRHLRFFAELGYGVEGVVNIGLSYRFCRASSK